MVCRFSKWSAPSPCMQHSIFGNGLHLLLVCSIPLSQSSRRLLPDLLRFSDSADLKNHSKSNLVHDVVSRAPQIDDMHVLII